jgi:hypothetical protein
MTTTSSDYNQLSMVYDFIEPYRINAETVVFRLFSGKGILPWPCQTWTFRNLS